MIFLCRWGEIFLTTPKFMVVFRITWSMWGFQLKNSLKITPKKFASDLRVMQLFLNESVSDFGGGIVFGLRKTI